MIVTLPAKFCALAEFAPNNLSPAKSSVRKEPYLITIEEYHELREDMLGVCIGCGHWQECVEPDGRKVPCDNCGEPGVYGCDELLAMGHVH